MKDAISFAALLVIAFGVTYCAVHVTKQQNMLIEIKASQDTQHIKLTELEKKLMVRPAPTKKAVRK